MEIVEQDPLRLEPSERAIHPLDWEAACAAYDESTYNAALDYIGPDDIVLDIGAGDLRFARQAARRARSVIAIERRPELLLASPNPDNLTVICDDALKVPFPPGVSVAVLLMRHCRHFAEYVAKLREIGCRSLITNARWGMGVEHISLVRQPHHSTIEPGWYACMCGAVGFKPGAPQAITSSTLNSVTSVETCPACSTPGC